MGRILTPKCANPLVYTSLNWCGRISDMNSPWAECIKKADESILKSLFQNCVADICEAEYLNMNQTQILCDTFEEMVDSCYILGKSLNLNWKFLWRGKTNCSN